MNTDRIREMLGRGEPVYMKDDFYDVAIRIAGQTDVFMKHKGRGEVSVPYDYDLVCDIELGGTFISEKEYANY